MQALKRESKSAYRLRKPAVVRSGDSSAQKRIDCKSEKIVLKSALQLSSGAQICLIAQDVVRMCIFVRKRASERAKCTQSQSTRDDERLE